MTSYESARIVERPSVSLRADMGRPLVRALRPSQWLKNVLLFVPSVLTLGVAWSLFDPGTWTRPVLHVAAAAGLFSLVAGALYLVNDVIDAPGDRVHPVKRQRPITSRRLSPLLALVVAAVLLTLALPLAFALDHTVGTLATGYAAIALVYSLGLKRVPYLELGIVAVSFAFRLRAGAEAGGVEIPLWLDLSVLLAALVLVAGKRRAELMTLGSQAVAHRGALRCYRPRALDLLVLMGAIGALAAWTALTVQWSGDEGAPVGGVLYAIPPFMAFGLARYLQILRRGGGGDPVGVFMRDRLLLTLVALCGVRAALLGVTIGA